MIERAFLCHTHPIVSSSRHQERGVEAVEFDQLKPGLSAEITSVVDDSVVVKHMGGEGVLSTPSMIGMMERAGIQAVQTMLPEGYTTVGFEVNVKHFAATPKGKKVTVRAELLEIDGRKLRFKVEAHDQDKKVGEGTHRRAIVQIGRHGN
jgi:fluoroacetyl-CoA thioesterase